MCSLTLRLRNGNEVVVDEASVRGCKVRDVSVEPDGTLLFWLKAGWPDCAIVLHPSKLPATVGELLAGGVACDETAQGATQNLTDRNAKTLGDRIDKLKQEMREVKLQLTDEISRCLTDLTPEQAAQATTQMVDTMKRDSTKIQALEQELARWKMAAAASVSCLEGDVSQTDTPEKLVQRLKKLHGWDSETGKFDEVRMRLDPARMLVTMRQLAAESAKNFTYHNPTYFVWSTLEAALEHVCKRQNLENVKPYELTD